MKETPPPILKITLPDGLTFDMMLVEGGVFDMGSNENNDEKPIRRVKVNSFHMSKFPVTQALWQAIMGENPSYCKGENRPVETVSWDDAKLFIEKLNLKLASDGVTLSHAVTKLRLPTEAEWEYAARGGNKSERFKYAGSDEIKEVAWYAYNSYGETKAVGLKYPNELGIYDMSGNVWEWCEDDWHRDYKNAPDDGAAWIDKPDRGHYRVQRGGSFFDNPLSCRSAYRDHIGPEARDKFLGFRLALSFQSVG